MIEFGSNKVRSIREYCLSSLATVYDKDESKAIMYELFFHIMGYKKHQVELNADVSLNESTIVEFVHSLKRLRNHEPLQYVTGKAWFRGLEFYVDPSVLIPRPETEELVECVLQDHIKSRDLSVLDLCTGSGCIAISLSRELPDAHVTALDISEAALDVARSNAQSNHASVDFLLADILKEDSLFQDDSFDIMISNPPYVKRSEANEMRRNVLDHEPSIALFVDDDDALIFYRRIVSLATRWLKNEGHLYFEINEQLGPQVADLLANAGFKNTLIIPDMYGKQRFVKGIWISSN